jgi:hypothetical protein
VVREIAIWWRAFQIGSQCPLVSLVLKRQACFDTTISDFFESNRTSPFVEELTEHFLTFLGERNDPFLCSVAAFERALLQVRAGSQETSEVEFDRNPDLAFEALERGETIPPAESEYCYRMTVARQLPRVFRCTREVIEYPPKGHKEPRE